MLKQLTKILISTRLMAVLFLAYGAALAIGTFVETWCYQLYWEYRPLSPPEAGELGGIPPTCLLDLYHRGSWGDSLHQR